LRWKNKMRKNLIVVLKNQGVGVMPTDTIYGLVGSALSKNAVKRIYTIKGRSPKKPFIVLISSIGDLQLFGIKPDSFIKKVLSRIWPGGVSVILPCKNKKLFYLHRGTNSLAFRLPENKSLRGLLRKTGPLVAPSANPEGVLPAKNLTEAKNYFKNKVDFYAGDKNIKGLPSTLIKIKNKKIIILREGAVKINPTGFNN